MMAAARILVALAAGFGMAYFALVGDWKQFWLVLIAAAIVGLAVEIVGRKEISNG